MKELHKIYFVNLYQTTGVLLMERISNHQLFTSIILFELGTATLFAQGIDAKQDAWIAILIAMLVGFVLLWIYTKLQQNFAEMNLVQIIIELLGKIVGGPLAVLYAFYFIYISTRNLRDFGELMNLTFLSETPQIVLTASLMLIISYILFLGIETLGSLSQIMLPFVLLFIIVTFVMIILSGKTDLTALSPILGKGIKPVLKASFPAVVTFPFGEMVLFLMYWCYVDPKEAIRKTSFLAVAISGVLLMLLSITIISVLGASQASISIIPLLEVIKLIGIANIFKNLDGIAVIFIFIGNLYKTALFFYGAILALTTLFKIIDSRWMIILISIFILWLSFVFEPNYAYHIWLGLQFTPKYIHIPFQILIPFLLLIISQLKKLINKIS